MTTVNTISTVNTIDDIKALTIRPNTVTILFGDTSRYWLWNAGSTATADNITVIQCTSGEDMTNAAEADVAAQILYKTQQNHFRGHK